MGHVLLVFVAALALGCGVSQAWRTEYEAATDPIEKGRILYENSCNRCHALYMPESYTKGDWRFYVRKYSPRARLTEDESALVLEYLRLHARNATR